MKFGMEYWYGRQAQLARDGGDEFVLTPEEWFALCDMEPGVKTTLNPVLLFGKPVRVAWESVIPCPHCGQLPTATKGAAMTQPSQHNPGG